MCSLSIRKVRLQTQNIEPGVPRRNMLGMFVHVAKSDGVMGLYRGVRFRKIEWV